MKPELLPVLKHQEQTKSIQNVKPIEKEELPIYFTDQELKTFFLQIPPERTRDKVFFLTLLGTGKRISEIVNVKKNDIDLENQRMRIIVLKKRKKTTSYIKLHPDVAYWLSIYIGPLKAEDQVFPFTRQYADELVKKYAHLAKITYKRTSCHIFRHTFAIRWLEQGKPINKLQRHLGHAHITTTMEYLKVVDKDYEETVDSLNIMGFLK